MRSIKHSTKQLQWHVKRHFFRSSFSVSKSPRESRSRYFVVAPTTKLSISWDFPRVCIRVISKLSSDCDRIVILVYFVIFPAELPRSCASLLRAQHPISMYIWCTPTFDLPRAQAEGSTRSRTPDRSRSIPIYRCREHTWKVPLTASLSRWGSPDRIFHLLSSSRSSSSIVRT